METTMLEILGVVAAVAAFATVATLLVRGRRNRRTEAALSWIGTLTVSPDSFATTRLAAEQEPAAAGDTLQVRILRNQVRTLEEALEQEQVHYSSSRGAEDLEIYRRRVHTVIRAMGGKLDAEAAAPEALARVSAAVDRLTVPETFARPTLTVAPASALRTREGVGVALLERPAVATAVRDAEAADVFVASDAEVPMPPAAAPSDHEVVLPVPPMAESGQNRRNRRWFRGRAA